MPRVIGLLFALACWSGCKADAAADYRGLCQRICKCEGCEVEDCVLEHTDRAKEQTMCREAGDAIVACKMRPGGARCETGGGMTLYMPTKKCMPAIEAFSECLGERHEVEHPPEPAHKLAPPGQTLEEALKIFCEAPRLMDLNMVPPSRRASKFAKFIDERVKNVEFEALFAAVAAAPFEQREAMLRNKLDRAGIERCDGLDMLARRPAPPQKSEPQSTVQK